MAIWTENAKLILEAKIDRDEVNRLLPLMAEQADKSNVRPDWATVLRHLEHDLDLYYQHGANNGGDRAAPGFTMLLDLMGNAADQAT